MSFCFNGTHAKRVVGATQTVFNSIIDPGIDAMIIAFQVCVTSTGVWETDSTIHNNAENTLSLGITVLSHQCRDVVIIPGTKGP